MRILLLGPTAPLFKGGIVHYTYNLCQELALQKEPFKLISFKRGYPKMFFPGGQKGDESKTPLHVKNQACLLDWLSPLSYWQTYRAIMQFKPERVVFQWWTWFWALPYLALLLPLRLFSKVKIVIIAHNPFDHETALYKNLASRLVLGMADRILVPNRALLKELKLTFPNKEIILAFHPLYDFFKQLGEKIELVKLPRPRLLFFGHVRHYKGVDLLIKALLRLWEKGERISLIIAGEFWEDQQTYLDLVPQKYRQNLLIIDRYLRNEELDALFREVEAVVIPYRSGSGSGPSKIALSYNKPLVATSVGDSPDLFALGEVGVLVAPNSVSALAEGVQKLFSKPLERFVPVINQVKRELTWAQLLAKIKA